ncbi:MAG: CapA family protein [Kofleriaceae bacterium]
MRHWVACIVALAVVGPRPARADELALAFVGDVMFGRYVADGFAPIAAEAVDPFASVAPVIQAADLAFANLETPVMAAPPPTSPYGVRMRFVATPARLATVAAAGFDVVSLANNHSYDMRAAGVAETPGHVAAAGLQAIGAAMAADPIRVATIARAGWRVGVVAATTVRNGSQRQGQPLLPFVEERDLAATVAPLVAAARADHDLVVVVMHWGVEYADQPSRRLVAAARAMIDAGADAVVGGHPHVLQPIERYRHGVIAYSLGNFLFDNTRAIERQTGILTLRYTRAATRGCLDHAAFAPALIDRRPLHHPSLATDRRGTIVRTRLRTLSAARPFATTWTEAPGAPGTLRVDGPCAAP